MFSVVIGKRFLCGVVVSAILITSYLTWSNGPFIYDVDGEVVVFMTTIDGHCLSCRCLEMTFRVYAVHVWWCSLYN